MNYESAEPSARSLIESLRSVGYSLPTAVADIIDNSIAAQARNVWLNFHWAGAKSHITIMDDGHGMSEDELRKAMRPGTSSPLDLRDSSDLGRFGLGLKTASFSQCRRVTVLSRRKTTRCASRTWDLDYVEATDEWRLLTDLGPAAPHLEPLKRIKSGTVVLWTKLDRLAVAENSGDAAAHNRFNDSIDHVKHHVALTFHRFLEDGSIKIHLNGHQVSPWNPFLEGMPGTYRTPEEHIPYRRSKVLFRGYVLPHKDMLSPEDYVAAAGSLGWTAHQGFYVYRNKRLVVAGDWLRLGRPNPWAKAEHYNLARIRLDLANDADGDWQLDVKKSTVRPPPLIRARLTELAENIRQRARSVFVHRGRFGKRTPAVEEFIRPWEPATRNGKRVYRINRAHPLVAEALKASGKKSPEIEALLRILEETVPVQQIWLDTSEENVETAVPYADVDFSVLRTDISRAFSFLVKSGINKATAKVKLGSIEPFNQYPKLIEEL